ncbi:MAG TPA: VWA domain-containing protein, partial [Planctomycetota bacterium]|nr:VWA domain-containing protein [Planctomycetota bacterium]
MFALLAPLVLLYMLRLRRPPRRVPSLLLWRQTLQDERVNAPLRRLRRDASLLLQIALLALLALAATQPLFGSKAVGASVVVLLDRSASMAARDAQGRSRLDLAKERAAELFAAHGGAELALVSFAAGAELNAPFTGDRRAFTAALTGVEVEEVGGDLGSALRLAAALGSQRALREVILLTDGALDDVAGFDLPFPLRCETLPAAGPNLGIVRLAARREAGGTWHVFAAVAASAPAGGAPPTARLRIEVEGELHAEIAVAPGPDVPERVEAQLPADAVASQDAAMLTLRLVPDGFDALAADDVACLALPPNRPLRVRLDEGLDAFARALAASDDVALDGGPTPDLVIGKTPLGGELAAPVTLSVGAVPEALADVVEVVAEEGRVIDQDRLDPLLAHVELEDLVLLDDVRLRAEQTEADVERAGFTTLVHAARGPLLVRHRAALGDQVAYGLLFDPERSTLPYRIAFPVLVDNLLGIARDAVGLRDVPGARTGTLPPLAAAPGARVALRGPDGARSELRAGDDGFVRGARAPRAGVWTIEDGVAPRRIGVGLLDLRESTLAAPEALAIGELSVETRAAEAAVAGTLWQPLVACALLLACAEWWVYRRRRRGAGA